LTKPALYLAFLPLSLSAAGTAETLFLTHCAPCHGPKGDGGRGANLAVRRLLHAPDDDALSAVIRDGIPGTQMPGTRMTAEENQALTAYVRGLARRQTSPAHGNATNGESLFWTKGRCGECHTVGPRGGRMGPDLTEAGAKRSAAYLRESVLDPEAEVPDTFAVYRRVIFMPDNFLQVRVVTTDGRTIHGVRVNEDAFSIQIRDYFDRQFSFRKDELRELQKHWGKSPMPGYRDVFTESELEDLTAYLVSLQGAK